MAQIELDGITKKYGSNTALDHVSLTISDNEFFVLFGPAGAGKTTLLKTIAGVEFPQEGLVKIGGEIVNHVEPMNRNVSMVFENYALYPHLNVYDNIASPLRSKLYRHDEDSIKSAVERVTKMMRIDGLLGRKPSQLSNGQRQRVAIGRCLVRNPNVFLMDEPLAHLDAKLRHFMRSELKEMQSSFNSTTIYVTHDYMEAMSLADRIAVLNKGKIEQLGTSQEMYYTPCNEFVSTLFGEPEINLFPAVPVRENGRLRLSVPGGNLLSLEPDVEKLLGSRGDEAYDIGIRGGDIRFSFEPRDGWIAGTVYASEPIGNKVILTAEVGQTKIRVTAPNDTRADLDQPVFLQPDMRNAILFDAEKKTYLIRSRAERLIGTKTPQTAARG